MVFIVEGANTDIRVYHNKVEQTGTLNISPGTFTTGTGTTVIGKFGTLYGTVIVDELAMWNRAPLSNRSGSAV